MNGMGAQFAAMYLTSVKQFPQTPQEFLDTLTTLHQRIFGSAEKHIAGRFRRDGEPVYFGREGRYVRCGAEPEHIQQALELLYGSLPRELTLLDQNGLCLAVARFFERFFMVHPFVDGNGRVGRFVADLMIRCSGRWRWNQRTFSSKERRQYLSALEFAHIHTRANGDDRFERRPDALRPLARWIRHRLVAVEPGWDVLDADEGRVED